MMKTFCCDLGWRGGVVVIAANEKDALEIIKKHSFHGSDVTKLIELKPNAKLTELKPNELYDFYGDS